VRLYTVGPIRVGDLSVMIRGYGSLFVSACLCLALGIFASLITRRSSMAVVVSYLLSFVAFVGVAFLARLALLLRNFRGGLFSPSAMDSSTRELLWSFLSPIFAFGAIADYAGGSGPWGELDLYWLGNVAFYTVVILGVLWASQYAFVRHYMQDR